MKRIRRYQMYTTQQSRWIHISAGPLFSYFHIHIDKRKTMFKVNPLDTNKCKLLNTS